VLEQIEACEILRRDEPIAAEWYWSNFRLVAGVWRIKPGLHKSKRKTQFANADATAN